MESEYEIFSKISEIDDSKNFEKIFYVGKK